MNDDDLVKILRDSKGWPTLGNAAADRIEELKAKLAEVTAERDHACDVADKDHARAEAAEAMLPRAYRAGVEAGANVSFDIAFSRVEKNIVSVMDKRFRREIRALPTPTIEQLKEMLKENGDETN